MSDEQAALTAVLEALWADMGKPERAGEDDILGVLVRMMLAQATSKANATRAFGDLLDRFGGEWGRVSTADVAEVAAAIEVGGLSNQKAPRIQKVLARAHADFGDYTLEPVRDWEPDAALAYVLGFDGVGPTTARFTLMSAAGMDLFPMNGGIRRVLARIGVLDGSESDRIAHEKAQAALPPGAAYAAHMTLVQHARTTCCTTPSCERCVVADCRMIGI